MTTKERAQNNEFQFSETCSHCPFMTEPCPTPNRTTCRGCQIFIESALNIEGQVENKIAEANKAARKIQNLCPICGADMAVWEEVFGEKHSCWERE